MQTPNLDPASVAKRQFSTALASVFGGILISLLFAFPIKWLWNWIVPGVFLGPEISAMQAWGITFLVRMILPSQVTINENKVNTNQ